jgi:hypothetical protein
MIGNDTTFKRKMKSIIGYNKNYESSKPFTNLDMPPGGSQLSLNKQNSYSSFISNNSNNNNYFTVS